MDRDLGVLSQAALETATYFSRALTWINNLLGIDNYYKE